MLLVYFCFILASCGLMGTKTIKHIKTDHYTLDWTQYCEIETCEPHNVEISNGKKNFLFATVIMFMVLTL